MKTVTIFISLFNYNKIIFKITKEFFVLKKKLVIVLQTVQKIAHNDMITEA